MSESSHTGFKTFRIVLYGLITVFAIATLGISAAMIDLFSEGGFPRIIYVARRPDWSSSDAVLLIFAASISGILCGGYWSIQAFRGQRKTSVGHGISVGITFLLFVVGSGLLTAWTADILNSSLCRALNNPNIRRPGYSGSSVSGPRCDSFLEKALITPVLGCAWTTTCLLFIALCASFWTPATDEKKKATVETTHVVLEKV